MSKRFKRTDSFRLPRLGKNIKKNQVWRRADGVQSKIRRKKRGYITIPTIGIRTPRSIRDKVQNLTPVLVHNVAELSKLGKESIAIIARVGARKKLEMIKKASELGIKVYNLGGKK